MKNNVIKLQPVGEVPKTNRKKTTALDKKIGEAFRFERQAKGRSLEWLGGELGCSQQQIGKIEHGENRLNVARLIEAAQALGFDAGAFVNALRDAQSVQDGAPAHTETVTLLRQTGARELMGLFNAMHPTDRVALIALARRLARLGIETE